DERPSLVPIERIEVPAQSLDEAARDGSASRVLRGDDAIAEIELSEDPSLGLAAADVLVDDPSRDHAGPRVERALAAEVGDRRYELDESEVREVFAIDV